MPSGAASLDAIALADVNTVLIDEPSDVHLSVTSDALDAGRLAGQHLLGLGHTEIGLIGPASDFWAFRMRERGFVQAVRAAGLTRCVRSSASQSSDGEWRSRGDARIARVARRPTAAFCTNDLIALGAMKACIETGVACSRRDVDLWVRRHRDGAPCDARVDDGSRSRARDRRASGAHAHSMVERGAPPAPSTIGTKPLGVRLIARGSTAPPGRRQRRDYEIHDDCDGARIDSARDTAVHSTHTATSCSRRYSADSILRRER